MTVTMLKAPAKSTSDPRKDSFAVRGARAAAVAAEHAASVDADSRFPAEAFEVLKRERLLSMMIPVELGGEAAGFGDVMEICYALGQACAATGLIFAMHHVKAACIIRHLDGADWHKAFLRRAAEGELLLASSTTEGQNGGNVRSSEAPIERDGSHIALNRMATVLSYALAADAVVTTARRTADAPGSDQVLVIFDKSDYRLVPTMGWNTLGMRGTCSAGFDLHATGVAEQIMPEAYSSIHAASMVPAAHLMWSSVWAGIAAGAVEKARLYTRKAARANGGQMPPGAVHFSRASAQLRQLNALICNNLSRFEAIADDHAALQQPDFQTTIGLLKVESSELAVTTVMSAMRACGLAGYRNDGEVSIGRALRDILSSPIMINNERIMANLATSTLLTPTPASLRA